MSESHHVSHTQHSEVHGKARFAALQLLAAGDQRCYINSSVKRRRAAGSSSGQRTWHRHHKGSLGGDRRLGARGHERAQPLADGGLGWAHVNGRARLGGCCGEIGGARALARECGRTCCARCQPRAGGRGRWLGAGRQPLLSPPVAGPPVRRVLCNGAALLHPGPGSIAARHENAALPLAQHAPRTAIAARRTGAAARPQLARPPQRAA